VGNVQPEAACQSVGRSARRNGDGVRNLFPRFKEWFLTPFSSPAGGKTPRGEKQAGEMDWKRSTRCQRGGRENGPVAFPIV
jgi:hypothetical protein